MPKIPGMESLWLKTLGDRRICVAVLDGAVDKSHPCFNGAELNQLQTLIPGIANQGIASQHGTHVTSIIFGQHGSSVQGIAPGCRGLIVPIFSDGKGDNLAPCSQIDLARAITQAVEQGANVINISGGQLTATPESDQLLANAVRLCQENNVVIVAAAGNDGCECLHLPAALESVLAVGAMDSQGNPLNFSNWGETYQTQGILAPGENILGAKPDGGTALRSGTSFAAPIVSGIIALLLSIQLQQGEQPNPHGIRDAILKSALPCNLQNSLDNRRCLVGSLNISGAYTLITKGGIQPMSNQIQEETMIQASEVNNTPQELTNQNNENEVEQSQAIEAINTSSQQIVPHSGMDIQAAEAKTSISVPTAMSIPGHPVGVTPNNPATLSVTPSGANGDCGCGGGGAKQIVFPIGRLGISFTTESERDAIQQQIGLTRPPTEQELLELFENSPWVAENVVWTLKLNATEIYAIKPTGSYSERGYVLLREYLGDQFDDTGTGINHALTVVPGQISGSVQLISGITVPVIMPYLPGLRNWTPGTLIRAAIGERPSQGAELWDIRRNILDGYLQRIYYSLLNLGVTPQDRAKNFSATNLGGITSVLEIITGENEDDQARLDSIAVEKSTICAPNSDCWDVKLIFFFPQNLQKARILALFTIDVSGVMPVSVNVTRSWPIY